MDKVSMKFSKFGLRPEIQVTVEYEKTPYGQEATFYTFRPFQRSYAQEWIDGTQGDIYDVPLSQILNLIFNKIVSFIMCVGGKAR